MKKNYHKKFKDIIFHDNDRKVKISNESISKIYRYRQTSLKSSEAGGVILGREDISTNNLIIDVVTQPYSKDKRSRYSFLRIDEEHIKIYNKLNQDNKNIYMYIGEWHSHPEYFPNYSAIDYSNWVRICEENDKNSFQYVSVNSSLNYSTHSPRILKGVISMFQGSSLFQSSAV